MTTVLNEVYDVIVLGTGAAGLVAALAATEAGATVGLFEKADAHWRVRVDTKGKPMVGLYAAGNVAAPSN